MKRIAILILFISSLAEAIMNGTVMTGQESFAPAVVGLGRKTAQGYHVFCTGTLLDESTVITAAHCLFSRDANRRDGDLYVVFGLTEKNGGLEARKMVCKIVHEKYVSAHKNDEIDIFEIALAQFEGSVPAGHHPLPFLPDDQALQERAKVTLAGYGFNNTNPPGGNGTLRYAVVPLKDTHSALTEVVTDERCAGTCNIDSGGPGFIKIGEEYFVWGITSRGDPGCVGIGHYTKIPSYRIWIQDTLEHTERWVNL